MELIQVMGLLTVFCTLMMMMSGLPPCIKMCKTGSTKNIPFPIFLLSLLCAVPMLHYGYRIGSEFILFINLISTCLQTTYLTLYILITDNKAKYLSFLAGGALYFVGLYSYVYSGVLSENEATQLIGSTSSKLITFLVVLPALQLVNNIRYKNADGIPTIMLLGTGAAGLCWLIYGIMLEDPNVYLPNIPGLAVTATKLGIVYLYGQEKTKTPFLKDV